MSDYQIFTLIRIEYDKYTYMAKPWEECLIEIKRLTSLLQ